MSGYHMPPVSRRGVSLPRLETVDMMVGGFGTYPEPQKSDLPVSYLDMAVLFKEHGHPSAPPTGWKWNLALNTMLPTKAQITVVMEELGYTPTSHINSRLARKVMIEDLIEGRTIERGAYRPKSGLKAATFLSRILFSVRQKHPISTDEWQSLWDRWLLELPKEASCTMLGRILSYRMGETFVQRGSRLDLMAPEVFPWSIRYKRVGGMVTLPLRKGEENPYMHLL